MIKYKVVDKRVTYIQDIRACYKHEGSNSKDMGGKMYQGSLSATYGEYLFIDEYAEQESFQKSLSSGILRQFINLGLIVEEEVEDTRVSPIKVVLASNPFERKPIKGKVFTDKVEPKAVAIPKEVIKVAEEPVVDVKATLEINSKTNPIVPATLSIAELRKMLQDAEDKKKAEKAEKAEKKAKVKAKKEVATEASKNKPENNFPTIAQSVNATEFSAKDELDKWDAEQAEMEQKGSVSKKETVVAKKEARFIPNALPKTIEMFLALKYQEGLHAISVMEDVNLLTLIAQNAKQSLTKMRAIQRLEALKRG